MVSYATAPEDTRKTNYYYSGQCKHPQIKKGKKIFGAA